MWKVSRRGGWGEEAVVVSTKGYGIRRWVVVGVVGLMMRMDRGRHRWKRMTRVGIGLGSWRSNELTRERRLVRRFIGSWAGSGWIGEGRDSGWTSGSSDCCFGSRCYTCLPKFYQASPRFIVVPEKKLDVSGKEAIEFRWDSKGGIKASSIGY